MLAVNLQACEIRQCARHAGILIHHISRPAVSLDTLEQKRVLEKTMTEMRAKQNRLYTILAHRTGKTLHAPALFKTKRKNPNDPKAI